MRLPSAPNLLSLHRLSRQALWKRTEGLAVMLPRRFDHLDQSVAAEKPMAKAAGLSSGKQRQQTQALMMLSTPTQRVALQTLAPQERLLSTVAAAPLRQGHRVARQLLADG